MRHCALLILAGLIAYAADADDLSGSVTISGGGDPSGHNYSWRITNAHTLPIDYVEFPHFHADMFMQPDGWTSDCTNLRRVGGGKDLPGVCKATAGSPASMIRPRASASFGMRVEKAGAARREGEVRVRFIDGTFATIGAVELPTAPSLGERWIMGVGLAIIFGIMIVMSRRSRASSTTND